MLVLSRKTLEAVIAKMTKDIATSLENENVKAIKDQDDFLKVWIPGVSRVLKEVAAADASLKTLVKNRGKYSLDEFSAAVNELDRNFYITEHYRCMHGSVQDYCSLTKRNEQKAQLSTLKGLLALMEGDKLELNNRMAEKIMGNASLIGLLG